MVINVWSWSWAPIPPDKATTEMIAIATSPAFDIEPPQNSADFMVFVPNKNAFGSPQCPDNKVNPSRISVNKKMELFVLGLSTKPSKYASKRLF
jgi:hypothetical protein